MASNNRRFPARLQNQAHLVAPLQPSQPGASTDFCKLPKRGAQAMRPNYTQPPEGSLLAQQRFPNKKNQAIAMTCRDEPTLQACNTRPRFPQKDRMRTARG